jgi:hypothetical protein
LRELWNKSAGSDDQRLLQVAPPSWLATTIEDDPEASRYLPETREILYKAGVDPYRPHALDIDHVRPPSDVFRMEPPEAEIQPERESEKQTS